MLDPDRLGGEDGVQRRLKSEAGCGSELASQGDDQHTVHVLQGDRQITAAPDVAK